jgi:hypothetical protein
LFERSSQSADLISGRQIERPAPSLAASRLRRRSLNANKKAARPARLGYNAATECAEATDTYVRNTETALLHFHDLLIRLSQICREKLRQS